MVQRIHKWCSVVSNSFAEHQTLYLNIKFLSITRNISMLWRIVVLACWFRRDRLRSRHQKCRPQMEQWSAGGHDVIEYEDCRETITCGKRLTSPCRKAEPIQWVSPFFSRRYCIYSLSFMKALIKIATRLDSTTVCRPPGLAQFARVGEPECL